jgi:hypothetical protein
MLDVRIPLSPTPSFLNRVVLLAKSIRRFYPDTMVTAYVGCDALETGTRINGAKALAADGIDVTFHPPRRKWVGSRSPYLGQMNARFESARADHVLICDADVICTRRFDELFEVDAVQGMQAHMPPYQDADLFRIFVANGLKPPPFDRMYSGAGIMTGPGNRGPWYVNSGVVFAPARLFDRLCKPYHDAIETLRKTINDTYWFDQLALMIAVAQSIVPAVSLSQRFNFPNQREFDPAFPDELRDVRFLHYLRTDTIDRDRDFASEEAMDAFVARRDLTGSNEVLRRTVDRLRQPPELSRSEDIPWA